MIFTEQEVIDRFRLHQYVHKLFNLCKKDKSEFTRGVDAATIYELFCIQYPNNVLSEAIVNNMLLTGGFVFTENEELNCIHATINRETYEVLDQKSKLKILSLVNKKTAITLRQMTLNKVTTEGIKQTAVDSSIQLFYKVFTINPTNRLYYQTTHKNRSTLKDAYEYYLLICNCLHLPPRSKREWINELLKLGVKKAKGFVDKKSGQTHFTNMFIPKTKEELQLTLDWGMCCISNGHSHITSLEELLENYSAGSKYSIFQQNLERMCIDESIRKKIQEEKEGTHCWREAQARALFVCSPEEKEEAKNNMGYNDGIQSKFEKIETNDSQIRYCHTQKRTRGYETEGDNSPATENPVESVAEDVIPGGEDSGTSESIKESRPNSEEQRNRDEEDPVFVESSNTDTESGTTEDVSGSGDDISDNDEPSLKEIATALLVPYKMAGGNFPLSMMKDWCEKMSVDINVEEYYDLLIDIIKELEQEK